MNEGVDASIERRVWCRQTKVSQCVTGSLVPLQGLLAGTLSKTPEVMGGKAPA